jgi:thiol:disulfide interchange protein
MKSGVSFLFACLFAAASSAQFGVSEPDVKITVLPGEDGVPRGEVGRFAVQVSLGAGWHVNANKPKDANLIPTEIMLKPAPGLSVQEVVYPEPKALKLPGVDGELSTYGGAFVVGVLLKAADDVAPGELQVDGSLKFQACDDMQCYMPKTLPFTFMVKISPKLQETKLQNVEVINSINFGAALPNDNAPSHVNTPVQTNAPVSEEVFPQTPASAPTMQGGLKELLAKFDIAGTATGYMPSKDFLKFLADAEKGAASNTSNPFEGMGIWMLILSVLAGGLLLNFTPCVLPLIPINLGIIGAGAKAGSKLRGFVLGGAYGAGIASIYGALGLIVVLGLSKTFGAINASPWFNAAIAVIFVVLALAMFDLYLIDFTRFQTKFGVARRPGGSVAAAFFMGAISALLAGACVAPVVISAIVYAQDQYAKGVRVALLLPFLVGVGMAIPWPFAGAGLSFLPKPGRWMERVKYAFGALILLFALYYGHLSYSIFQSRSAATDQNAALVAEGWTASLEDGLAEAERDQKPVFVDFWATWCKNCLTMDATTFKDAAVKESLNGYVKVKFQAETPSESTTQAVLEPFGVVGLPTYVILKPKARS